MKNIKRGFCLILIISLILALFACSSAKDEKDASSIEETPYNVKEFLISTPEEQGLDSDAIINVMEYASFQEMPFSSMLISKNGYLVTEIYYGSADRDTVMPMYSITKSVLSALVGIAIDEGYIESAEQKICDFYPDVEIAEEDFGKKEMTIKHLLTMSSGIVADELWDMFDGVSDIGEFIFSYQYENAPGEVFKYDSAALQILACILQKQTGMTLYEYATEKLFKPLGITSVTWDADQNGVNYGGSGIQMTPRDMVRFGELYLNDGVWDGKRILSSDWIAETITPSEKDKGYGYLFWLEYDYPIYSAYGAFGQRIHVVPEHDMVIVFTTYADVTYPQYNMVRKIIMENVYDEPLPQNPENEEIIAEMMKDVKEKMPPSE